MANWKKSGDSQLQDAEAAREEERTKGANWTPEERLVHLPSEVQDGAEQKKAAGASESVVEAALRAVASLTGVVEGLANRLNKLEAVPAAKIDFSIPLMKCASCQQTLYSATQKRGVCTGDHRSVWVGPKDMRHAELFQPVKINGVEYVGRCVIPTILFDTIFAQISQWEHNEDKKIMSGGRILGHLRGGSTAYATGGTPLGAVPIM